MQVNNLSRFLLITLTIIFVGAFLYTLNPQSVKAEDWLTGWSYRKKITIDQSNVDADLTDFPLLVKITSDSNLSTALVNGYDIRFTSSDGTTLLKYERESWSGGNGTAVTAVIWVKVPSISATTNTDIYMYYGKADATDGQDASNVWDSDFAGVWHMKEDPSGGSPQILDSTSNNNDGTSAGTMTIDDQVTGKFNGSLDFDGSNDYININHNATIDFTGAESFTIDLWVKIGPQFVGTETKVLAKRVGGGNWYTIQLIERKRPTFEYNGGANLGWYDTSPDITDNQWHHILVTINRLNTTASLYVDGNHIASDTNFISDLSNNANLQMSSWYYSGSPRGIMDGLIDEVRIASTARTAEWIKFEYNNMNESDNELAISSEQDNVTPIRTSISPASTSTITDSTQTITFTTNGNSTCYVSTDGDESYQDMSDDNLCTGSGTTSQTCTTPTLIEGTNYVYIACSDGDSDTADTNERLIYNLDTTTPQVSSAGGNSMMLLVLQAQTQAKEQNQQDPQISLMQKMIELLTEIMRLLMVRKGLI